jgi:hypothetical protein
MLPQLGIKHCHNAEFIFHVCVQLRNLGYRNHHRHRTSLSKKPSRWPRCMRRGDRQIRVLKNTSHLEGLRFPVTLRVLNDAQRIDPEVSNSQPRTNLGRIGKSSWQGHQGHATPKLISRRFGQLQRLSIAPAMAQACIFVGWFMVNVFNDREIASWSVQRSQVYEAIRKKGFQERIAQRMRRDTVVDPLSNQRLASLGVGTETRVGQTLDTTSQI